MDGRGDVRRRPGGPLFRPFFVEGRSTRRCDGGGWRYCTSPITVLLAASPNTYACTLVVDHGTSITETSTISSTSLTITTTLSTTTETSVVSYIDGPRVGNGLGGTLCSSAAYGVNQAKVLCTADDNCTVLHDHGYDLRVDLPSTERDRKRRGPRHPCIPPPPGLQGLGSPAGPPAGLREPLGGG